MAEWVRAADPIAAAARCLGQAIGAVDADRGAVRLAIPGGSALAALAPARREAGEAWARVRLTWIDERCVPFGDPRSNRGEAHRQGGLKGAAGVLPLWLDGETPAAALARIRAGLQADFAGALDVLLLGMGPDGHIASLFPGRGPVAEPVAHVPDSPKPPAGRITLGRGLLGTARRSVLLATGSAKRAALERLQAGDPALPATGLQGLVVITDLQLPEASCGLEQGARS